MGKVLKIYGKGFKNMGGLCIGHLYWIRQSNTGRKNGIKVRSCTEGACKSVQLHNIDSMCVTALPTQISLDWLIIYIFIFMHTGVDACAHEHTPQ